MQPPGRSEGHKPLMQSEEIKEAFMKDRKPSEAIEDFLDSVAFMEKEYKTHYESVNEEDRRLQDLLHELEFADDKAARNRAATKLHRSRRKRRESKDKVLLYTEVYKFFTDKTNRDVLNRMRQLLGRQRKEEEYLGGERVYKKRVGNGQ